MVFRWAMEFSWMVEVFCLVWVVFSWVVEFGWMVMGFSWVVVMFSWVVVVLIGCGGNV